MSYEEETFFLILRQKQRHIGIVLFLTSQRQWAHIIVPIFLTHNGYQLLITQPN